MTEENTLSQEALENGHRTVGQALTDEQRAEVEERKEAAINNEPAGASAETAETAAEGQ